jgi:hypothetical protein
MHLEVETLMELVISAKGILKDLGEGCGFSILNDSGLKTLKLIFNNNF